MKTAKDSGVISSRGECGNLPAHTATPWTADGNGIHFETRCVALTHMEPKAVRDADAALIVRAVNNLDGLVAALNDTCRILEAVGYTMQFSNGQKERIEIARAALKASMDTDSQQTTRDK